MSNAIVNSADGDIITISNGACMWESAIQFNDYKSIQIIGSGTNTATGTVLVSTNIDFCLWYRSNSSNYTARIADIQFIGDNANNSGVLLFGGNQPAAKTHGVTVCSNLYFPSVPGRAINMGSTDSHGVITRCYFATPIVGNNNQPVSASGNSYLSWTNSNPLGTTNAVYVENCYFFMPTNTGNGPFDCYDGAQIVARYCTFDGPVTVGWHGYDSQATSARTHEIYMCVFTNTLDPTQTGNYWVNHRGGSGVLWSNKFWNGATTPAQMIYYRAKTNEANNTLGSYGWVKPTLGTPNTFGLLHLDLSGGNPANGAQFALTTPQAGGFSQTYMWTNNTPAAANHILIGANVAASLANAQAAINNAAGGGTTYGAATVKHTFAAGIAISGSTLVVTNYLDGNEDGTGWPAHMQVGTILSSITTNIQTRYITTAWANERNGSPVDAWGPQTADPYHAIIVAAGRDYTNAASGPAGYSPLTYPHPLLGAVSSSPGTSAKTGNGRTKNKGSGGRFIFQ